MKVFFAFALALLNFANSAKILGIFNIASHSHFAPGQKLMNALVDRGHDVTVITPYNSVSSKLKLVHLNGFEEDMKDKTAISFNAQSASILENIRQFHKFGDELTGKTLNHPNVQALLKSNQTFDIIIMERLSNEAFHGFCHHYKSACVVYSALSSNYWLNHIVGNPQNPAYMPQWYLGRVGPMDFWSRLFNTAILTMETVYFNLFILPEQNAKMRKYFPTVPHLNDLFRETDLIFLNSHVSFTDAVPYVPNMVEIGGFHVKPTENISTELKTFLDEANDGVIYFSMGSFLKCSEMADEKLNVFKQAFSQLKQRVLWKSDVEMKNLENVKTLKWVPQMGVLAHPNVKLFITHGGVFSIIEAVYTGMPIIGIPVFADQQNNILRCKNAGFGAILDFNELTVDNILRTIKTVLDNPVYSENAKKRSQLLRDRPMKPIDTFVYWIEFVLRHRGHKYLKSAAVDLAWYQYYLLDIAAFLILLISLSCVLTIWLMRKLKQLLRKARRGDKNKIS